MSITSGRSLRRFDGWSVQDMLVREREPAVRSSSARGWVEEVEKSSSMDMSESEAPEEVPWSSRELLRRLFRSNDFLLASLAHSGVGCRCSYCLLSRWTYSLPLIMSSASVLRSFRSRVLEASETEMRSSSLSTQAMCLPSFAGVSPLLNGGAASKPAGSVPCPEESRKKSYAICQFW